MEPNEPNIVQISMVGMALIDIVAQKADDIKGSSYENEIISVIKEMERDVKDADGDRILKDIETLKTLCEEHEIIPRARGNYSNEQARLEGEIPMELLNSIRNRLDIVIVLFNETQI